MPLSSSAPKRDSEIVSWGRFPLVLSICFVSVMVWLVVVGMMANPSEEKHSPAAVENYPFNWMVLKAGTQRPPFQEFLLHSLFYDRWLYLLGSLMALWFCGKNLEARWGSRRFGMFYFFVTVGSGLLGLLVSSIRFHLSGGVEEEAWIYGGAAAGLACLTACSLMDEDRLIWQVISQKFLLWAMVFLGATGLIFLEQEGLSYAGDSHSPRVLLLPQLSGIFLSWVFLRLMPAADRLLERWNRFRQEKERERVRRIRLRVDELLEKISCQGKQSLTPEEESFLKQASKHFKKQA